MNCDLEFGFIKVWPLNKGQTLSEDLFSIVSPILLIVNCQKLIVIIVIFACPSVALAKEGNLLIETCLELVIWNLCIVCNL